VTWVQGKTSNICHYYEPTIPYWGVYLASSLRINYINWTKEVLKDDSYPQTNKSTSEK
jgi:hypothetical protein